VGPGRDGFRLRAGGGHLVFSWTPGRSVVGAWSRGQIWIWAFSGLAWETGGSRPSPGLRAEGELCTERSLK
jgi:hypothetical protein